MTIVFQLDSRYESSTRFQVELFSPLTRDAVVKTGLLNHYRHDNPLQAFNILASNRLCGSQNCRSEHLHTNAVVKTYHNLLQAFNRPCACQNGLAEPLQSFKAVVKTGLLRLLTGIAVVKTGMKIF